MHTEFTPTQKRALAVATGIAILFGAYFLRRFLILIVVAAVVAYLFTPLYNRLRSRVNVGLSATATLLAATATVVVPLSGVIFLAVFQIGQMVTEIGHWAATTDMTALAQDADVGQRTAGQGSVPAHQPHDGNGARRHWDSRSERRSVRAAIRSALRLAASPRRSPSTIIFVYVFCRY